MKPPQRGSVGQVDFATYVIALASVWPPKWRRHECALATSRDVRGRAETLPGL